MGNDGASTALQRLAEAGVLPATLPAEMTAQRAGVYPSLLSEYFRGALIGTAIGDALGRPAEGCSSTDLRQRYGRLQDFKPWAGWQAGPKGTVTDDTQLTVCVAECLVSHNGQLDPEDLARRFVAWLPVGRGKGSTCAEAVDALTRGVPWYEAGVRSAGNGAAMRAAPVGLAHLEDVNGLRQDAALSAFVTHVHPMAIVSAVAHAWLVARLATTPPGTLDRDGLVGELCSAISDLHDPGEVERDWQSRRGKTGDRVRLRERLAEVPNWLRASPEEASEWFYSGAFVLESLPMALWHFLRSSDDPEEAVVGAVMGGHDADTVASMTGAYVGAYLGEDAFPARWRGEELEFADELRGLADQLLALSQPDRSSPDARA